MKVITINWDMFCDMCDMLTMECPDEHPRIEAVMEFIKKATSSEVEP